MAMVDRGSRCQGQLGGSRAGVKELDATVCLNETEAPICRVSREERLKGNRKEKRTSDESDETEVRNKETNRPKTGNISQPYSFGSLATWSRGRSSWPGTGDKGSSWLKAAMGADCRLSEI